MADTLHAWLDTLQQQQADLVRLATLASLAVRIEPPLLRTLRLRFLPLAEPGLESDLWFSPLVDTSDDSACSLLPAVVPLLRQRLRAAGDLETVWALQQALHQHMPASLRLEEEIAYRDAALADAAPSVRQAALAERLRPALKALVSEGKRGEQVARWALQALPRLPDAARDLPELRQLHAGTSARLLLPGQAQPWQDGPVLDLQTDGWVLPAAASARTALVLQRDGAMLVLQAHDPSAAAAPAGLLQVPAGRLARLQVRVTTGDGRQHHASLRARPGERLPLPGEPVDIEITNEAGEVYGFEPDSPPPPTDAPALRPLPRYDSSAHALYISHAQADDAALDGWVQRFVSALQTHLGQRLGGKPRIFMHRLAGPDAAPAFNAQQDAFATIAFVGDGFVQSDWCQRELAWPARTYGAAQAQRRIWVVALSEPAMRRQTEAPAWRELDPDQTLPWLAFYDKTGQRPLQNDSSDGGQYWQMISRMAVEIETRIQADQEAPPPGASSSPQDSVAVHLLVERNPNDGDAGTEIGAALNQRWQALQQTRPDLPAAQLWIEAFDIADLPGIALEAADGVVLLWGEKREDSLQAQIDKVEQRWDDPGVGLVAHLSPPRPRQTQRLPADAWPGLRFEAPRGTKAPVLQLVAEDGPALDRLLLQMLDRATRRERRREGRPNGKDNPA